MNVPKQQTSFIVTAIPVEAAEAVRTQGSWKGFPGITSLAKGYGPCRLCLKTFEVDKDERILFNYNAFYGRAELPLPGPIFIHRKPCEAYSCCGFPPDLRNLPMLFEAFDADGNMTRRVPVLETEIESLMGEILADDAVQHIYVRNAEAGCFMAWIDRKNLD